MKRQQDNWGRGIFNFTPSPTVKREVFGKMGREYWNGAEAAHRRVMMKAAGYLDEDIRKSPTSECPIPIWRVLRGRPISGR